MQVSGIEPSLASGEEISNASPTPSFRPFFVPKSLFSRTILLVSRCFGRENKGLHVRDRFTIATAVGLRLHSFHVREHLTFHSLAEPDPPCRWPCVEALHFTTVPLRGSTPANPTPDSRRCSRV